MRGTRPRISIAALVVLAVGLITWRLAAPTVASAGVFAQQSGASASGGTSATATLAPTAGGATIVACVGSDVALLSIGDDRGNRYRPAGQIRNSSGAGTLRLYYANNAKAGVTAVTITHAWGHSDIVAAEYGPTGAAERVAVNDAGYNAGEAWSSGTTARTRRSNELVVGCAFEVYGSELPVTFMPGAGFTARANQRGVFLEDRVATSRGAFAAAGTRAPGDNLNVVAAVATFPLTNPPAAATTSTTATTSDTTTTTADPTPTTDAPATTTTTAAPTTTTAPPPQPPPPPAGGDGPRVLFTDVVTGPVSGGPGGLGVPITIYGTGLGASRGTSTVTIGGVEVAAYLGWGQGIALNPGLDAVVVQPGPNVTGGPIVVTVAGRASNADQTFAPNGGKILAIAPSGSDQADCSLATPCATIGAVATTRMAPGDTVLVRGGDYSESEIWIREALGHSGTAGQQKAIVAYPGERVVLSNAARPFIVDANYVTVAGIEFRNGKSLGIPDTGLPGLRGNRFVDNGFTGVIAWAAVDTHGDDHLVAGNVCDVSGSTVGTQGHCYYVSYGSGVQLRYNVGRGAPGYGIHVFDQQRSTSDFRRVITNLLIEGNTLDGSTLRSGLIIAMNDEGGRGNLIDGVTVRGNRLGLNSHLGVLVNGLVRNVTITDNTFDENGRQGVHIAAGVRNVTVSANSIAQSENANCRQDCSWYRTAHIEVSPQAQGVSVSANRYSPQPPVVLGSTDPSPG